MNNPQKKIAILGCRGIPSSHGGFETFADDLSDYLVNKGWDVTVYCQTEGSGKIVIDFYKKIKRVIIPVKGNGTFSTIKFDFFTTLHAIKEKTPSLLLGYNTAIFNIFFYLTKTKIATNMDGIEYNREKWGFLAKSWFRLNERFGIWFSNHLYADHPKIKEHLLKFSSPEKITMIPYGSHRIEAADEQLLEKWNLQKDSFALVIARPEPENSIYEIIKAYSSEKRGHPLVVLGKYDFNNNSYHQKIKKIASEEILFVGAIYEKNVLESLRQFCKFYVHGHRVGGTNPSLVEALGAYSAILAHNNHFNKWVAGKESLFFSGAEDCSQSIKKIYTSDNLHKSMKNSSLIRYEEEFKLENVLQKYEHSLAAVIKEK
jgi:glycosyltransferase involved in cell wall biosynthesis